MPASPRRVPRSPRALARHYTAFTTAQPLRGGVGCGVGSDCWLLLETNGDRERILAATTAANRAKRHCSQQESAHDHRGWGARKPVPVTRVESARTRERVMLGGIAVDSGRERLRGDAHAAGRRRGNIPVNLSGIKDRPGQATLECRHAPARQRGSARIHRVDRGAPNMSTSHHVQPLTGVSDTAPFRGPPHRAPAPPQRRPDGAGGGGGCGIYT
jgi:hypothetical protein